MAPLPPGVMDSDPIVKSQHLSLKDLSLGIQALASKGNLHELVSLPENSTQVTTGLDLKLLSLKFHTKVKKSCIAHKFIFYFYANCQVILPDGITKVVFPPGGFLGGQVFYESPPGRALRRQVSVHTDP